MGPTNEINTNTSLTVSSYEKYSLGYFKNRGALKNLKDIFEYVSFDCFQVLS
jgi:hypothetical protein